MMATDRRSQAVAEFMGEGQLDIAGRQELSIVLNCDQTGVEGRSTTVTQGGLLRTYSTPVTWSTDRGRDEHVEFIGLVFIEVI